jgi:hypothetical protein
MGCDEQYMQCVKRFSQSQIKHQDRIPMQLDLYMFMHYSNFSVSLTVIFVNARGLWDTGRIT